MPEHMSPIPEVSDSTRTVSNCVVSNENKSLQSSPHSPANAYVEDTNVRVPINGNRNRHRPASVYSGVNAEPGIHSRRASTRASTVLSAQSRAVEIGTNICDSAEDSDGVEMTEEDGSRPPARSDEEDVANALTLMSGGGTAAQPVKYGTDTTSSDPDYTPGFSTRRTKRKYVYHCRARAPPSGPSKKKQRFMTHAACTESSFRELKCCERKKCFQFVNLAHVVTTSKEVMQMNLVQRKATLANMLGEGQVFIFDGRGVCSEFLVKAFRFSRDLQCAVKGTERACLKKTTPVSDTQASRLRTKDCVVVFLRRIAEQAGNAMPDCPDIHLPFYDKKEVYQMFCTQFKALESVKPPVSSYFYSVWKDSVPHIKIRRVTRFTVCSTCEMFKRHMQQAVRTGAEMSMIQSDRRAHYKLIATERQAYKMNQDKSAVSPAEYMSIVIDGADQSAFGLPHFVAVTKDTSGHAIKVKLVGLIEHGVENRASLFTMTDNFETGANHIIETMHRYLDRRNGQIGLPQTLFIQMDNCTRENKNRYLFAYLESLVSWGVFREVHVSFLPVGHTHTDIDQLFSRTATRLHKNCAITLKDLHSELRVSYSPTPTVNHMSHVVNFSGLCDEERVLWDTRRRPFSQFRYFRFSRNTHTRRHDDCSETKDYPVTCHVKVNSTDNWENLRPVWDGEGYGGFLTTTPRLNKTPCTKLKCPTDHSQVLKRLKSEEVRIGSAAKMKELRDLVADVYETRQQPFHWDLRSVFERAHTQSEERGVLEGNLTGADETVEGCELEYEINSFVAVRPEAQTATLPFWVGKINRLNKTSDGKVTSLVVHWYETVGNGDVYSSRYRQMTTSRDKRKKTPWESEVCPDTVMVTFQGFTKKMKLSSEVSKKLQSTVGACGAG